MTRTEKASTQEIEKHKQKHANLTLEQKKQREENRKNLQIKIAEQNTYSGLSAKLNLMRKSYKDLAVQNKQNTKEGKALLKNINQLDAKLKTVDATVGQFQRNVGNYSGAFKKFGKNVLAAFGIVGGVSMLAGVIRNIAQESIALANEAKGVEFAFGRIENSAAILEQARAQTQGLLSDLDIQKSIVEFDNFGLALEQLPELLEFVAVRATQTGKSFEQLRSSLIEGLSKKSKLRIDNLGISLEELNAELKKTPVFIEAVANIAKRQLAEAGDVIKEADKAQQRYNATVSNAKVLFGDFINQAVKPSITSLGSLVEAISRTVFSKKELSTTLVEEQVALNLLVSELDSANTSEDRRAKIIETLNSQYPEFLEHLDLETATSEQLRTELQKVNDAYLNRIVLQREVEKGQNLQSKVNRAGGTAGEIKGKLFNQLNEAVAKFGLNAKVTLDDIEKSAADVLKELEGQDLGVYDRHYGTPSNIKSTLGNLENFKNNIASLNEQLEEQANNIEVVKDQLGIKTEAERADNEELERKVELYNKLFGTSLTELNADQLVQLNEALEDLDIGSEDAAKTISNLRKKVSGLRKEFEESEIGTKKYTELKKELAKVEKELAIATGKTKDNLELDPKSLAGIKKEIQEINVEISKTSDYTKLEAALDRLKAKEAELRALEAQIERINKNLAVTEGPIKTALGDAVNQEFGGAGSFLTEIIGPEAGFHEDKDPITKETKLLGQIKALREKFGIDEILQKEKLSKKDLKILEEFENAKILLELQNAANLAKAKLDIKFKSNEEELQADKEHLDAVSALHDEQNAQDEQRANDKKEKLKEILDQAFEYANKASELVFRIENERAERSREIKLKALDDEYSKKIKAAEGDSKEQERLAEELAKKKEEVELKAAKKKQQLALKEAVTGAALAIIKAIISGGGIPWALPAVAATAAATAFQIAGIVAQKFEMGGEVDGPSHTQGGKLVEVEGGEFIMSKKAVMRPGVKPILRNLNDLKPLPRVPVPDPGFRRSAFDGEIPAPIYNIAYQQVQKEYRRTEKISEDIALSLKDIVKEDIIPAMKEAIKESMEEIIPEIKQGVKDGTFEGSSLGGEEGFRRREREQIERDNSQK